jgi:predicted Zn-dependent protease
MAPLTPEQARTLMDKALRLSKADACEVNLNASTGGNIRFARNTVNTAGANEDLQMVIQSNFGTRSGTVTINEFDDATIERAVRRSEELAHLAPEDEEFMPPMGQQQYMTTQAFFDNVANIAPEYRTQVASDSIGPAKAKDCTAAGFLQDGAGWQAMKNTAGLFAYHRQTGANFSVTVRSNDGTGSGYGSCEANDLSKFDVATASRIAIEKAAASRNPRAIEPGKYTVILEPEAGINLIGNLLFNMAARPADEGRSFLAKPGGGTKVGEKLVDERVHIWSDPAQPDVPTSPWQGDGRPFERTDWVAGGVVKNMFYSRYWAQKKGVKAVPFPPNLIMDGGTATTEELIRDTTRGVLVTRTWYIRSVDPQTVLVTGLTRDGTFYIENGEIKYAVKNFRFNESPVIMLNNLDALGRQQRVSGSDAGITSLMPVMRIRDFTFSSLSEAV